MEERKPRNRHHDGDYADYQEYVRVFLATTGRAEMYNDSVVEAAWERQTDGIAAALDCVAAAEQRAAR